jgi:hypothetical protein
MSAPHSMGRSQRVVDDQWHARVMRDLGEGFDVGDQPARIGDAFGIDGLGLVGDLGLEAVGVGGIGPLHPPVEFGEALVELVDRTAIELARGHEFIARAHQRVEGQKLRGMAAAAGKTGAAVFQRRDAFFQHRIGRVHQPRIDVAEDLQVEQRCGVIGILEHEGRGLIDRRGARAGGGIGLGSGVNGKGVESVIGHDVPPIERVGSSIRLRCAGPRRGHRDIAPGPDRPDAQNVCKPPAPHQRG